MQSESVVESDCITHEISFSCVNNVSLQTMQNDFQDSKADSVIRADPSVCDCKCRDTYTLVTTIVIIQEIYKKRLPCGSKR